MEKQEWFIHARRNASLHHASFLMTALNGKGWLPTVDFHVSDVIVTGFPQKGCFIFLNKEELYPGGKKLKDIQVSVDSNPDFITHFKRKTRELFGAFFFSCDRIDEANLSLLSLPELKELYQEYINAMLAGPLITVQVYGIEAMVDPNYRIMGDLQNQLEKLGKIEEKDHYKQIFLTNDGETVAFTERKDFYRICAHLNTPEVRAFFLQNSEDLEKQLDSIPEAKVLIEKHINKYYWVNTEYLGGGWTKTKWLELFQAALTDADVQPEDRLKELLALSEEASWQKKKAIEELELSQETIHAIDALGVFLAERDWTKGYVARSLLSYHSLLREVANRMDSSFENLLQYTHLELQEYFDQGKQLSSEEIEKRRTEGYAFRVRDGVIQLESGQQAIERIFEQENISHPLKDLPAEKEFQGLSASRGVATGKARVIDEASKIAEFQDGEILVTYMTTIEFTPLFRKAVAVITDEGGMSCHAAIVSREFKLPCIVGTKIATRVVRTGDLLEVDATRGIVTILD